MKSETRFAKDVRQQPESMRKRLRFMKRNRFLKRCAAWPKSSMTRSL